MLVYLFIAILSVLIQKLVSQRDNFNYDSPRKINDHLRVGTYNNPLANIPNTPTTNTGLMEEELLYLLSSLLNFTYDIAVPTDVKQLGILRGNNTWTGALGLLQRQEADLSISFGPRNTPRSNAFDLTPVIISDNIGIMVPFPTIGISATAIGDIYTPATWVMMMLAFAVVTSGIWLIGRVKSNDETKFGALAIWMLGVVCNQGGWIRSKSLAYQFLFGSWSLALLVVAYAYQGTLVSRLSAPSINYLVRSLEDVVADETISPLTLRESATHSEFRDSLIPNFNAINNRFESRPELLTSSTAKAVELMLNKTRSIWIFSDIVIDNEIRNDLSRTGVCRAMLLNNRIMTRRNGLFLQKGSKWTPTVARQVMLLRQNGMGNYLENKFKMSTTKKCSINEAAIRTQEYNGPLTFSQMKGAFYVLGAGLFMASIAFISEVIYFRYLMLKFSKKRKIKARRNL